MRKMLVVLCIILLLLPATNAQDITTVAGASTSITLAAPEDAAEPLTFIIDALPVNGVLTGEAPNFVYQPNAGFVGTDMLLYTLIDGAGIVTSSTIVIQVTEDETTSAPAVDAIIEPQTTVELEANSNAAFTIALGENFELLTEPENGTLSGQVPDIVYTPDEGFNGEDSFSYSVVIDGVEQTYDVTFAVGNVNGLVPATRPRNTYAASPGLSLALTELVRPSGLTSLRVEATSFVQSDRVSVVVEASGSTEAAESAITAAGGVIISTAPSYVIAEVPVSSLLNLGANPSITYIRLPQRFTTMGNIDVDRPAANLSELSVALEPMTGTVTSEAVAYTNASAWHTAGYTGDGVKIGVIDYGFDGTGSYTADLSCMVEVKNANNTPYTNMGSGDGIPALETICDMAPDADVYARHVADESQFYQAMDNLANLNVDIIYAAIQPLSTITSHMSDPMSFDGSNAIDAKVDTVVGVNDIMVVVPSGDNHDSNYEGPLDLIVADINGDNSEVLMVHTFDGEISGWGTDVFTKLKDDTPFDSELNITSGSLTFVLTWNEWDTQTVELDMSLYKYNTTTLAWEEFVNSAEDWWPPREVLTVSYDQIPVGRYRLVITAAGGGIPSDYENGQWIQLTELQNNVVIFQDRYNYSSIIAPATAQTAFTVGAFYQAGPTTRTLDTFSAHGPANTLNGGDPFAGVGGYFQPQIVAQNGTDVAYGGAYIDGFNGTRAAAAHVAGAAALVKEFNPTYTRFELENDLRIRALQNSSDPGDSGPDTAYGYGYLYLGDPGTISCTIDTIGIYSASHFGWYMRNSNDTGWANLVFSYGTPLNQSIIGDWDGDGIDTVGIFDNGIFYLRNSNTTGFANVQFAFGNPTDVPIAGDWNGDGVDTIGVYRPSQGVWLLRNTNSAGDPDLAFVFGILNETPVTGDWDGDGIDTIGVFSANGGTWYLRNSNSTGFADHSIVYGSPVINTPITGDWNGDCKDTIGVYHRASANWFLKNTIETGFADIQFLYGLPNEMPIAGDWDGN